MSRIALITLPLTGHIDPAMAAADALVRAGHTVTVVGMADTLARLPATLAGTYTLAPETWPLGSLDAYLDDLTRIRGLWGLRRAIRHIAEIEAGLITALPHALTELGVDAVLHDQLRPGAGLVAQGMGLAQISLACALPMNHDPDVAPPFLGWPYRGEGPRADYGRWLAFGGWRVTDALLSPLGDVLHAGAARFGLQTSGAFGGRIGDWASPVADLSQGIAALDFPRARPPIYVGPLRRAGRGVRVAHVPGRDMVFCSLGSLMGSRGRIFASVARACAARDQRLVIATGGAAAPQNLPGHVEVYDFVDQRQVLGLASACVIHGGHNTVLDAAAAGVSMVIVPQAFEQAAIAARVVRAGIGRVVRRANARHIGHALDALDSARSDRVRSQLFAAGGTQALVAQVDRAVRIGGVRGEAVCDARYVGDFAAAE